MSQTPETPEAGGHNLQRALGHLPAHEPDPATWPRIEAQLAADEELTRVVPALPKHEPDEDLWNAIVARLEENASSTAPPVPAEPATVRPMWSSPAFRRVMAVAASVLILLGVWWQQRTVEPAAPGIRETLAVSEEEVAPPMPTSIAVSADPLEQEGRSFIDAHCSSLPTVCQSGEFKSLRTQLTELEEEEKQLRQAARRFGESPELLRQQAQLITLKATITRELVQLLIT